MSRPTDNGARWYVSQEGGVSPFGPRAFLTLSVRVSPARLCGLAGGPSPLKEVPLGGL